MSIGLVVANRLSEANVTVGVIDAGTYRPEDKVINDAHPQNVLGDPRVATALGNATYDWLFTVNGHTLLMTTHAYPLM